MRKKDRTYNILFISISIIGITLLHYLTVASKWGIHDFYRRLYYIPMIVSAFKFRLRGGLLASLIISILYAPHLLLYFGEMNIEVLNQFLEIVIFIIIGTGTGFLVESDFKKKKRLEIQIKKLTNLENYTQNILDSITNGFIAVDRNLMIKSMNKEGQKLFQLDGGLEGRNLSTLFVEYDHVEKILKDVLKYNKKVLNMEIKCISKDEKDVYVKLFAYPLLSITDKIEGIVLVLEDVSEIRKLESQVRTAEKLSAVGELASGVAHEIRNPLGIIKTISQTIYEDTEDEELKEGLEIIIHEIDRANSVIQSLLNFAKPNIHEGKFQSIDGLIQDILLITKKYAQQNHIEMNYELQEDVKLFVDSEALKQAFVNIIFNAVQAMPDRGDLHVRLLKEKNWVKVSFEDSGIGISQEKIEKIFEPFYTTKDTGTGLGLSITHRIIEEHKGYMEVDSAIGKGTRIDVYLPILKEGEQDD
ncbi:ATP-binding protein [Anaerophilus nitritogenes]|uniref:ATP-binding protein n=1 Tax=Anaerophilus nitritogenes TaxID=2498136 RepID=UPI0013EC4C9F|nr:ATP-binding protein [Anaerophilus nitritogenes]